MNIADTVPLATIVCGNKKSVWKRPIDGKNLIDIDTSINDAASH